MSNLKFWTSAESGTVLTRGQHKTPNEALMAANTRAQAELGSPSHTPNQDVRGQTLRLLRLQQNWDPASLATQACISLRQLYQLEGGETSLFYSKSLRNQAGRRVATILGAQWDELEQPPSPAIQDKHIKLVSTTAPPNPHGHPTGGKQLPGGSNGSGAHHGKPEPGGNAHGAGQARCGHAGGPDPGHGPNQPPGTDAHGAAPLEPQTAPTVDVCGVAAGRRGRRRHRLGLGPVWAGQAVEKPDTCAKGGGLQSAPFIF